MRMVKFVIGNIESFHWNNMNPTSRIGKNRFSKRQSICFSDYEAESVIFQFIYSKWSIP